MTQATPTFLHPAKPQSYLDADWGDENILGIGESLTRILPPEKGATRFALLTYIVPAKKEFIHYINSAGKLSVVRCHTRRSAKYSVLELAECCQVLKNVPMMDSQFRLVALALKYMNADPKTGRYATPKGGHPDIQFEIGYVQLTANGFREIVSEVRGLEIEGATNPEEYDFIMMPRESGKGQTYKIAAKSGSKALYLSQPELVAQVREAAAPFADGAALEKLLGKAVSKDEMNVLLKGVSVSSAAITNPADIDNTDDL